MKRIFKQFTAAALAITMVSTTALGAETPALAAENQTVKAVQSAGITVTYLDREQAFTDANGKHVLPIVYNGTTYLPVRAVASLAGLGVSWDGATSTIALTTKGTQRSYDGDLSATDVNADVVIAQDINVTLDGCLRFFCDAKGESVFPAVCGGTTYLPVRAVCGLVNMDVNWDQGASTVELGAIAKTVAVPQEILPAHNFSGFSRAGDNWTYLTLEEVAAAHGFAGDPNFKNDGIIVTPTKMFGRTFTNGYFNAGYPEESTTREAKELEYHFGGKYKTITFSVLSEKTDLLVRAQVGHTANRKCWYMPTEYTAPAGKMITVSFDITGLDRVRFKFGEDIGHKCFNMIVTDIKLTQ